MSIRPHRIEVSDLELDDTRDRLRRTRWSPAVAGAGDRYGIDLDLLRTVVDHWERFDWRVAEARLNAYPHYLTEIDGVDLHFWHIPSSDPDAIPLLLLHGWPGSVVEFFALLDRLTEPAAHGAPDAPAFHVILPEIPGFGFGGKPTEPGWGPNRIADAFDTLVHDRLGYAEYAIQGGDWGSLLGARVARRHPDHVRAFHTNFPFTFPAGDHVPTPEWGGHMQMITGYLHVQQLVPDAFTVGLDDTPAGTAAWILEKFVAWSDNDGDLTAVVDLDTLVTNIGFYWYGRSLASSTRLYRESAIEDATTGGMVIGPPQIPVPTGVAAFPKEPYLSPRAWLEDVYTITRWTDLPAGGHFAALERPDDLLGEIRAFFPTHFPATDIQKTEAHA